MPTLALALTGILAATTLSVAGLPSTGPAAAATTSAPVSRAASCGSWRWPVKTGTDADRYTVSRTVIHTSIRHLRSFTAPGSFPYYYRNHRFAGPERHTYQLDRTHLVAYRIEDDGDVHLILRNGRGKRMIAEIPKPACVGARSRWRSAIRSARTTFMNHDPATTSWHYVNQVITIRGLGFFDEVHGQNGVAPNGIELHPVIRVRFP